MKFLKEATDRGVQLPAAALRLCGFSSGNKLELHAEDSALVVLRQNMTAMELLRAAYNLQQLSDHLFSHLADVLGDCGGCEDSCPFRTPDDPAINLPKQLLQDAGIPIGSHLHAYADEATGTVVVTAAGQDSDLRDVPPDMLDMLTEFGVCIGNLAEHLMKGDIVYGD